MLFSTTTLGMGYVCCLRLIENLFEETEFNAEDMLESAKTQVIQIFTRFHRLDPPTVETRTTHSVYLELTLRLNLEHLSFLQANGIQVPDSLAKNGVIASATGTKKAAEKVLYQNALVYLAELGVTPKWAEDTKYKIEVEQSPDIASRASSICEKLKPYGYDKWHFEINRKLQTSSKGVVILQATDKDNHPMLSLGYKQYFSTTPTIQDHVDAINMFLKYGPITIFDFQSL